MGQKPDCIIPFNDIMKRCGYPRWENSTMMVVKSLLLPLVEERPYDLAGQRCTGVFCEHWRSLRKACC